MATPGFQVALADLAQNGRLTVPQGGRAMDPLTILSLATAAGQTGVSALGVRNQKKEQKAARKERKQAQAASNINAAATGGADILAEFMINRKRRETRNKAVMSLASVLATAPKAPIGVR